MNFEKWLAKREPIICENSRAVGLLQRILPFDLSKISIAGFVLCDQKISKTARQYEKIRYVQRLELLFVGYWLMYTYYYVKSVFINKSLSKACEQNPFALEAKKNERKRTYLSKRPLLNWKSYR